MVTKKMAKRLSEQCYELLQFYQRILCELKNVFEKIKIKDKLLKLANYLTTTKNEIRREAQNFMRRVIELNEKAEQAKDAADKLVKQIKTMTGTLLTVLNHKNTEQLLEIAINLFLRENRDKKKTIDEVIEKLNVQKEVLEIQIGIKNLLGHVRNKETEVNKKKKMDERWERIKYYGGATIFVSGAAVACTLVPAVGWITGIALTTGSAIISYPTAAGYAEGVCIKELTKKSRNGLAALENLDTSMNDMRKSVVALDEEVEERKKKMQDIRNAMYKSNVDTDYVRSDFDPTFTLLNESAKELQGLCMEYLNMNQDGED